jgi:hypothetical protein
MNDAQEIYARWLERGARFTFAFALLSLALYLGGVLEPLVPLDDLPRLWTLSAADLRREAHAPGGWDWLRFVRYGDYLNQLGISFFALLSLVCTARVIPAFAKSGERVPAALAVLQVIVLLIAAL